MADVIHHVVVDCESDAEQHIPLSDEEAAAREKAAVAAAERESAVRHQREADIAAVKNALPQETHGPLSRLLGLPLDGS